MRIPTSQLRPTQRTDTDRVAARLAELRAGIMPPLLVERRRDGSGLYSVWEGHHRLEACVRLFGPAFEIECDLCDGRGRPIVRLPIAALTAAPCHVPGSKPERVEHYRAMIRAGLALPAVVLNGSVVHDGNNRVEALRLERGDDAQIDCVEISATRAI